MIKKHLRCYTAVELAWQQHILRWKTQGFLFNQYIAPGEVLLKFTSDTGWEGVIDLQVWFSKVMQQSAKMSSSSWTVQQLEALFTNSRRPLEGLPEELEYRRLESKGTIERTKIVDSWFSCLLPQGRVWFCEVPAHLMRLEYSTERMNAGHLPVDILFEVGHSYVSIRLLKRCNVGDILLVNHIENFIILAGKIFGGFIRDEEGFMFDENIVEDTNLDNDEMDNNSDVVPDSAALMPRGKVSVRLGFILQQSRISINELESFYLGKVLPCQVDVEKNMLITANGVAIARGEVVWVEDRLGVEIKELYQEPGNDPK